MSLNKALLIGINYSGSDNELRGCQNDVLNVMSYLKERFAVVREVNLNPLGHCAQGNEQKEDAGSVEGAKGTERFEVIHESGEPVSLTKCGCVPCKQSQKKLTPEELSQLKEPDPLTNLDMSKSTLDVVVMTDFQSGRLYPTKANILNAFHWLTHGATAESRLYLHYSGHGSHERDLNGEEDDGQDESLVPVDFLQVGCIIDDVLRRELIDPLPEGCNLRLIIDACHSGTACDLRYNYRDVDVNVSDTKPHVNVKQTDTKCNVVSISGCRDSQVSADAWINRNFAGALSATLFEIMRDPQQDKSYEEVYKKLLQLLRERGYSQKPQISSGHVISLKNKFDLF